MRISILMLIVICILGCSEGEPSIEFKMSQVGVMGDSSSTSKGMIGDAGYFAIDNKQQVYFIDRGYKLVKMFSKSGVYMRDFGKGPGDGPGEFNNPDGIAVDEEGGVYVLDSQKRTVTIFDSVGNVNKIIKTPFIAANITATSPGIFYITGMPFSYEGDLIYKYDINRKDSSAIPVLKFCERIDPGNNRALATNGARIGLINDKQGNIIYNFPYPYEIRFYNKKGALINKLSRELKNFDPPYYKQMNGLQVNMCDNMVLDPIFVSDSILAYRILQNSLKKQLVDFYNIKTNKYIGTIDAQELGIHQSAQIKGDGQGNIYHCKASPYPHIEKISLKLETK